MGDRLLFSACTGRHCAFPMRMPNPNSIVDSSHAPMGLESLFSTGAGIWRKASVASPDSNSVLDNFCLRDWTRGKYDKHSLATSTLNDS